jgi:hypothetical protein
LKSGRNVCPTLVAAAQTKRGSMSDIRRLLNDPSCLAIVLSTVLRIKRTLDGAEIDKSSQT